MREMAGVLIHDADRPRGIQRPGLDDLAQVPDARRRRPGALGPRLVVREELAVRLHVRAATRGVHDDRGVAPREGVDVEARELARPLAFTGVGVKSAAAGLLDRQRERIEPGATQRPRQRTGRLALAQHLARPFHDPAEGHAGGTRGLARAADEARLEVLDEPRAGGTGGSERDGAPFDSDEISDELDAAAR